MADNVYYCSNCGGIMEFNVKSQTLKCPNCDTEVKIVDDRRNIIEHNFNERVARSVLVNEKHSSTMQCNGCGARVEVSADCTATECPYCGSKYVLAQKQEDAIIPDGVLPFKIDKNDVKQRFNTWVSKRWLAPGKLKNLYERDKIQGVYLPYWTFDADIVCDYSAEGGKRRREKVRKSDGSVTEKTVVDWYHTHGRIKHFFDDVLVKGSKNLKPSLLKGVEPYDLKKDLASYSPQYLSGYSAECYSVSLNDAHKEACQTIEKELHSMARNDVLKRYDEARNIRIAPDYRNETYKHILIPIYSTAYSYRDKKYTVLINGQTGKIKGDYPKSPVKIGIIVAVIVAILIMIFASSAKADETEYIPSSEAGVVYDTGYAYDEYVYDEYGYDENYLLEEKNDNSVALWGSRSDGYKENNTIDYQEELKDGTF